MKEGEGLIGIETDRTKVDVLKNMVASTPGYQMRVEDGNKVVIDTPTNLGALSLLVIAARLWPNVWGEFMADYAGSRATLYLTGDQIAERV